MARKTHGLRAYFLGSWPGEKFPYGMRLHRTFYQATRGSELFKDISFDTNGPEPYSEDLDELISSFVFSGVIELDIFKGYSISKGMKKVLLREHSSSLDEHEKKQINEITKKMYVLFSQK